MYYFGFFNKRHRDLIVYCLPTTGLSIILPLSYYLSIIIPTTGLLSYQCVCSSPATSYGPHCDTVTEKRCTTPPTLEHGGDMTVIEGYKGRNMVLMGCEEGYLLQGDYPR